MPRKVFEQELARLNVDLAEMGRRVDASMQGTVQCLKAMDIRLAKTIFPRDREINTMEKSIEQSCMNLLALQQPPVCVIMTARRSVSYLPDRIACII